MYEQKNKKRGMTMLEVLVVIGILVLVTSLVLVSFSRFRNQSILSLEAENLVSLIAKARTDTLSSKEDDVYGVHLEGTRAVLFKGDTFVEPDVHNIEVVFDPKFTLSDISLNGGGSDILFQRLSGRTDHYGIISLVAGSASTTVLIYETGLVDID